MSVVPAKAGIHPNYRELVSFAFGYARWLALESSAVGCARKLPLVRSVAISV